MRRRTRTTAVAAALLRSTLRATRRDVALCIASGLAWQAVAMAVPWTLERAIDDGIVGRDSEALWWWAAALVALGGVRWAGDAARHWWVEQAGAHAADHLRRRIVARIVAMGDGEVAAHRHGDLAARAVGDTRTVWLWVSGIATLATAAFTLAGVLTLLVTLHPSLALVGLATVPLTALSAARRAGAHGRAAAALAAGSGDYSGVVESALAGIRTIKGLGAEPEMLRRALATSDRLQRRALALARVESGWVAAAAAIPAAGVASGLWIGGTGVIDGTVTVGSVVAFAGWMGLLVDATVTLTDRLVDRNAALAAADRLAALLQPEQPAPHRSPPGRPTPEPRTAPATARHGSVGGNGATARTASGLQVDRLAGAWNGRPVLHDVTFSAGVGQWLAIIGTTGAGKSTLLRILAGLEPATAGRISHDGVDLATAGPAWRRRVVLVPQGVALVSGTVRDLLRLAAPDASDADMEDALAAAGAADIVAALGGLHGRLGERGFSLSGGQRQRLALATAAVRRPAVLLLDDVTSALDPATEIRVLGALRRALPEATVVLATHRLAAAAACDECLRLAGGGLWPVATSDLAAMLGGDRR